MKQLLVKNHVFMQCSSICSVLPVQNSGNAKAKAEETCSVKNIVEYNDGFRANYSVQLNLHGACWLMPALRKSIHRQFDSKEKTKKETIFDGGTGNCRHVRNVSEPPMCW